MIKPIQTWDFAAQAGHVHQINVRGAAPEKADAVLEWCDGRAENNGAFKRFYLTRSVDGWQGRALAPQGASSLRVLVFHWTQAGAPPQGEYSCEIAVAEPAQPRPVRVAVAHNRAPQNPTVEGNIAILCETIREAGAQGVQLLCLTENFPDRLVDSPLSTRSVTQDDSRVQPLFEAVREANLYAVLALHEKTPDGIFIAAWLLSPQGEIIGRYNKRNLTLSEMEMGLSPGDEHGVFDTPLGRIGVLICWDAWFPESATELARRGAEIICFPLAGDGVPEHAEAMWRARALDNQVFWLASCTDNCSKAPSRVVAPNGAFLSETQVPNSLAIADIDLNARVEWFWLSVGPYLSETRNVFEHSRLS